MLTYIKKYKNKICSLIFFIVSCLYLVDSILAFKEGKTLTGILNILTGICMAVIASVFLLSRNTTK